MCIPLTGAVTLVLVTTRYLEGLEVSFPGPIAKLRCALVVEIGVALINVVSVAQDTCLQSGFLTKDEQKQNDNVSICQKRARASRDLPARYRNPHLQRPTL